MEAYVGLDDVDEGSQVGDANSPTASVTARSVVDDSPGPVPPGRVLSLRRSNSASLTLQPSRLAGVATLPPAYPGEAGLEGSVPGRPGGRVLTPNGSWINSAGWRSGRYGDPLRASFSGSSEQ